MIQLGMQVEDMRGYLGVVAASPRGGKWLVLAAPSMRFVNTNLMTTPTKSGWRNASFIKTNPRKGAFIFITFIIVAE